MPPSNALAASLLIVSAMIAEVSCLSPSFGSRPLRLVEDTAAAAGRSHHGLNTYALTARDVDIQTSVGAGDMGSPRHGATRVRVKLTANQLQQAMPVITASASEGLLHDVIDAFQFLKNYAIADSLVSVINQQAGAGSSPLFPKACVAAKASSLLINAPDKDTGSTAQADISRFITAAEAAGKRDLWTRSAPTNMLMLIPGQSVGAVADIMKAELDNSIAAAPAVVLTLDVVHEPHMVNELTDHGEQTLDDDAHYHFFTPAGVSVDAAKFLATLKASGNYLQALHMFAKGGPCYQVADGTACQFSPSSNTYAMGICFQESCIEATNCNTAGSPNGGACTWPAEVQQYSTCAQGTCEVTTSGADSTLSCTCSAAVCTAGETCRAAVGNCDVAEVCTPEGQCPNDAKLPDGATCHWVPNIGNKRNHHLSADLSSLPATKVSAEEAKARLSSVPAYVKEWPLCKGTCYSGVCALKWDHPACCRVQRADASTTAEGTTQSSGHWEGHDWFCWGY